MEKPTIRFKGYTEDWEQRKLGDNIVEYTEKTTENNQYPVDISHILGNLITVIFDYQILRKPLKILSL